MASLSTVYSIATILSSVAGMGAAFLGNKIYPLIGGSAPPPPTPGEVKEATRVAADKAEKLAAAELFEIKEAENAKDAFETTPEPVPEPPAEVSEPVPEPPAEVSDPVPEPVPEPPAEVSEPVPEPVPEPPAEVSEPVPEPVPEPPAEVSEQVPESLPEESLKPKGGKNRKRR